MWGKQTTRENYQPQVCQFSSTARISQGLIFAFKIMSFPAQASVSIWKNIYFLSSSGFVIEIHTACDI